MKYRIAEKEVKSMSETATMSKKEVKAYVAELYSTISENKKKVSHELGLYKAAAKDVAGSAKYFAKAERAYEKKQSSKNEVKYEETKYDLLECAATYNSIGECINSLITDIRAAYTEIVALLADKKAAKYASECDKYLIGINNDINKIQAITEGPFVNNKPLHLMEHCTVSCVIVTSEYPARNKHLNRRLAVFHNPYLSW